MSDGASERRAETGWAEDRLARAGALCAEGNYESALEVYDDLIAHASDAGGAWRAAIAYAFLGRALVYRALRSPEGEVATYEEAIRRFDSDPDPTVAAPLLEVIKNHALALFNLGRADAALSAFEMHVVTARRLESVVGRGRVVEALAAKARCLARLGRHDQALRAADEALSASNEMAALQALEARLARGFILSRMGREEEAIGEYDYVLETAPRDERPAAVIAQTLYNKAILLRRINRDDEALTMAQSLSAIHSDDPAVQRREADGLIRQSDIYADDGDRAAAIEALENLSMRFRDNRDEDLAERAVRADLFRAALLSEAGDLEGALEVFERVSLATDERQGQKFRNHRAQAAYGAAAALERMGMLSDAVRLYRAIVASFDPAESAEIAEAHRYAHARLDLLGDRH